MENDELLNIKKKNKNLKKPLVYGAAAFLIFIILVIAYAMYSNSQEENVVLPPQVNEASNQNSDNFQNLAIEEENNENKSVSNSKNETKENSENVAIAQNGEVNVADKNQAMENVNVNVEENNQNQQINISNETTSMTNSSESLKENAKEAESVKTNVKPSQKNSKKSSSIKAEEGKYFVQVAALMKHRKPNKHFLELIKKEGYDYIFYNTYVIKDGQKIAVTKILIGPFKNKDEARKNLKFIKEKIVKNAFIFKVKE